MDHREPRGRYRGRRRVPSASRSRYAAVMMTACIGAGVVALGTGTALPDLRPSSDFTLVDTSTLSTDLAERTAGHRASRSDNGGVGGAAEQAAPDAFVLPLHSYTLTSRFGMRWGRLHAGIDLAAPCGTPIHAIARGRVVMARWNGGYGNAVMIDHGGGVVSVYGHASKVLVREGQMVNLGDRVSLIGNTGHSFGCHLHLEIRIKGDPVDPIGWLRGKGADVPGKTDVLTA